MNGSFISLSKYLLSVSDGHSFAQIGRTFIIEKQ